MWAVKKSLRSGDLEHGEAPVAGLRQHRTLWKVGDEGSTKGHRFTDWEIASRSSEDLSDQFRLKVEQRQGEPTRSVEIEAAILPHQAAIGGRRESNPGFLGRVPSDFCALRAGAGGNHRNGGEACQ